MHLEQQNLRTPVILIDIPRLRQGSEEGLLLPLQALWP
jgi:hypothetical protein